MLRKRTFQLTLIIVCSCWLTADAAKKKRVGPVEKAHRGKVVVLDKAPPMRGFSSQRKFAAFLKAHRITRLEPTDKKEQKAWKLRYMAFFRNAPGDYEVKLKIYDVTDRRERLVAADTIYTRDKEERVLVGDLILEKPDFQPGREYVIKFADTRNFTLAKTELRLNGRKERYSGKVTFSEEETKGP